MAPKRSGNPLPIYIALAASVMLNVVLIATRGGSGSSDATIAEDSDLAGSGEVEGDSALGVAEAEATTGPIASQKVPTPVAAGAAAPASAAATNAAAAAGDWTI